MSAGLRLRGLCKSFGETNAVDHIDIDIDPGELLVLVGPSGSGKSTVLRLVAGLEDSTGGAIEIGGRDVATVPSKDRDVAMVFQDYALYPHMTCFDNIGYALKVRGTPKAEIRDRVLRTARLLDIEEQLPRRPGTLSGGQRQRVAMGRAIVRDPAVFLMDEPLSNLDARLRVYMRTELRSLQQRLAVTTLFVTHDQTEAMTMGDRVAVICAGRLQQIGAPATVYDAPANVFVAGFIGSPAMNFLSADVADGTATVAGSLIPLPPQANLAGRSTVIVGIRPEHVLLERSDDAMKARVQAVEQLGNETVVHLDIDGRAPHLPELGDLATAAPRCDDGRVPLVARVAGRAHLRVGDIVNASVQNAQVFDSGTHLSVR
jgi:multiple sugar transport system ATP-binding protein